MSLELQFFGATGEVTGSLYVLRTGSYTVLLECGLLQGGKENEKRNRDPFPVAVDDIDAVILSHAHIDHSGRVPLLVKQGYSGPVYVQNATKALCEIMLPDSGYLNEKDAEWENRKRRRKGKSLIQPLYTLEDAESCLQQFKSAAYGDEVTVVPGLTLRFFDAGHILGSAIVEITYSNEAESRTLVFSGDLGFRDAPVMNPPVVLPEADIVLLESTYGDRLHRPFADTMDELAGVFDAARAGRGNVLIPAFTVGRTQDLLYLMAENYERWNLGNWQIFLDSPMAIEATAAYSKFRHLYGAKLFGPDSNLPELPNFHATRTTQESIGINEIDSGAIIIAGSGMCSGGRILHHLKNNVWRPECHLVIVGFQAYGTLGRRLVEGAETIKLFGDEHRVRIQLHTIGGLSAHGDQADLIAWYGAFQNRPPVYLVHGERKAQQALAKKIRKDLDAPVAIAERAQTIQI
jgi:metallo-beta-lactamase family protein